MWTKVYRRVLFITELPSAPVGAYGGTSASSEVGFFLESFGARKLSQWSTRRRLIRAQNYASSNVTTNQVRIVLPAKKIVSIEIIHRQNGTLLVLVANKCKAAGRSGFLVAHKMNIYQLSTQNNKLIMHQPISSNYNIVIIR